MLLLDRLAVRNTDDHLRNHGFLRSPAGRALSPVFAVNPEPDLAVELQTAIIGVAEAEALLEFAPLRQITTPEARAILFEVVGQSDSGERLRSPCSSPDTSWRPSAKPSKRNRRGSERCSDEPAFSASPAGRRCWTESGTGGPGASVCSRR